MSELKKILIADDDPVIRELLNEALNSEDRALYFSENGSDAVEKAFKIYPDLILTDVDMPVMDGFEVCRRLRGNALTEEIPIIVITGLNDRESRLEAIHSGADEFLNKPVDIYELRLRVKTILRLDRYRKMIKARDEKAAMENRLRQAEQMESAQLKKYADDLVRTFQAEKEKRKELSAANDELVKLTDALKKSSSELSASHKTLKAAYLDTIKRLVLAAEYKDEDTGDHIARISCYSALIAKKLMLPARDVENIGYAAPMHDIGKIGIPDHILVKPGKLTDEEFDCIKTHPIIGARILAGSKSEILGLASEVAISHHEKWNGTGYPKGISEDKIPLFGRIVGFADVFDALTTQRPYKDPYPMEVVCSIIRKERGAHFDPAIVDIFFENLEEFIQIKESFGLADAVTTDEYTVSQRDRTDMKDFENNSEALH